MINPEEDGITHINIYSKGKTDLGRMLSNFAKFPIETVDGKFMSVECILNVTIVNLEIK